jgi:hypothetical protein
VKIIIEVEPLNLFDSVEKVLQIGVKSKVKLWFQGKVTGG